MSDRLALLYPRPSLRDLTSLVVARDAGVVLLTGDGALRKAAAKEGVEVHGVLWVLDRLVGEAGLSPPEAARSLRLMVRGGAWLPETGGRGAASGVVGLSVGGGRSQKPVASGSEGLIPGRILKSRVSSKAGFARPAGASFRGDRF